MIAAPVPHGVHFRARLLFFRITPLLLLTKIVLIMNKNETFLSKAIPLLLKARMLLLILKRIIKLGQFHYFYSSQTLVISILVLKLKIQYLVRIILETHAGLLEANHTFVFNVFDFICINERCIHIEVCLV